MIEISHNHQDGTLLSGSCKGDSIYEIVKLHGFAWFPSIRMIGIRGSRDHVANRARIETAANALRAAGHDVTVTIDDTPRDREQVLADQTDRLDERRDRLAGRAQRHEATAQAAYNRASEIADMRYGQPIIVGHHSERRARADQARIDRGMHVATDNWRAAERATRAADAVGKRRDRATQPDAVQRRINRAEARIRKLRRELDGYTRQFRDHAGKPYYVEEHEPIGGAPRETALARLAQLDGQLRYDREQLAALVAGGYVVPGPTTVKVGDQIHDGLRWRTVAKVNKATVSVPSGYGWVDKVRFDEIREVRSGG